MTQPASTTLLTVRAAATAAATPLPLDQRQAMVTEVLDALALGAPWTTGGEGAQRIAASGRDSGVPGPHWRFFHATAVIVPVALHSVARAARPLSGNRLLASLAQGYRLLDRLANREDGGVRPEAAAAVLAAGLATDCATDALVHALGLAVPLSPALWPAGPVARRPRPLPDPARLCQALAELSLTALTDATAGAVGAADPLGPAGPLQAEGLARLWQTTAPTATLGRRPFAAELALQPALTAVASAAQALDLTHAEQVRHITIETTEALARDAMDRRPASPTEARASLPITIAALLLGVPWTGDNPAFRTLADRVAITVTARGDAQWTTHHAAPARATVTAILASPTQGGGPLLRSSKTWSSAWTTAEDAQALWRRTLVARCAQRLSGQLGPRATSALLEAIRTLPDREDCRAWAASLAGQSPS